MTPSPADLPPAVAAFHDAQAHTLRLLHAAKAQATPGARWRDIDDALRKGAREAGFTAWFHPPELVAIRAGRPVSVRELVLQDGDRLQLDLAPAHARACGDAGASWIVGQPDDALIETARAAARACCTFASRWKTIGEVFIFAQSFAVNHRVTLANRHAVGHRVLLPEGPWATAWPYAARAGLSLLLRHQVHRLNPARMEGLFAFRPVLSTGGIATGGIEASFEELVWVGPERRVILGRDSLDTVGLAPAAP